MSPVLDHSKDIERHERDINDLWEALNSKVDGIYDHMDKKFETFTTKTSTEFRALSKEVAERLPPWVTVVISLLTFMLGGSLTYIGILTR